MATAPLPTATVRAGGVSLLLLSLALASCSTGFAYTGYAVDALFAPPERIDLPLADGRPGYAYAIRTHPELPSRGTIVFFTGSGCASLRYYLRDYFASFPLPYRIVAPVKEGLSPSSAGLFGCPEAFDDVNVYPRWRADGVALIRRLIADGIDGDLVVMGASEGGTLAADMAATFGEATHLAMLASGGLPQREELRILTRRRSGADGAAWLEEQYALVAADPDNPRKQAIGQTYRYWTSVLDIDPLSFLLPLDIPVFVAVGESDMMVPIESARRVSSAYAEAGKTNATVVTVPNASHVFVDDRGRSHRAEVFAALAKWLTGGNGSKGE